MQPASLLEIFVWLAAECHWAAIEELGYAIRIRPLDVTIFSAA